jgi:hypothetical protein
VIQGSHYIDGILEPLPDGERLLWQGRPVDGWTFACRVFRVRLLMIYFAVLLMSRAGWLLSSGSSPDQALVSTLILLPFAAAAVGMLVLIAWLMARTTIYAITDHRVVMRIGIALPMTINIPFRSIGSAGLKPYLDGTGDIPLALSSGDRIAYLTLWPHARPWRFASTEPMLRAVPNAKEVASILAAALAAHLARGGGEAVSTKTSDSDQPATVQSRQFVTAFQ